MKIRTKLTLWYAGVLVLIVVALGAFLVWRLQEDLTGGLDSSLDTRAEQTIRALEDPEEEDVPLDLEEIDIGPVGVAPSGNVTQILTRDGRLIRSAGDGIDEPLIAPSSGGVVRVPLRATVEHETSRYRILAVELERSRNVLVVATSTAQSDAAVRRLLVLLAIALPVAVGLSALGGFVVTRRAFRPVDEMTRTAAAVGSDDASIRLDVPTTDDEIGRLGRTLNAMLDRLHTSIEQQRRFAADASHELRTPLAIMQSEIDVALRSPHGTDDRRAELLSLREEVARMTAIVDNLLLLARTDEGRVELVRADVDLVAVARAVRDRMEASARSTGSTLAVESDGSVVVPGDGLRLEQLLTNLVDNAIRHTPAGGRIGVEVGSTDRDAFIAVADTGPGIPSDDLPHVFERFYRVDRARARTRGGAGLGLAICRSIADAHGGEITVTSDPSGTTFRVRLPRRAD